MGQIKLDNSTNFYDSTIVKQRCDYINFTGAKRLIRLDFNETDNL